MSLRLAGGGRVRASALWAWGTTRPLQPGWWQPLADPGKARLLQSSWRVGWAWTPFTGKKGGGDPQKC